VCPCDDGWIGITSDRWIGVGMSERGEARKRETDVGMMGDGGGSMTMRTRACQY